jgi:hypothetical protein
MNRQSKIEFIVAFGLREFRVMARSAGNACRKVFAQEIAAGRMKSVLPPIDPDTGIWEGVSVSPANGSVHRVPAPAARASSKPCVNCKTQHERPRPFCSAECSHEFKANGRVPRVAVSAA